MKTGDSIHTLRPIRHHSTGVILPRDGRYMSEIENLGRILIKINFGEAGEEYIFPDEIEVKHEPR